MNLAAVLLAVLAGASPCLASGTGAVVASPAPEKKPALASARIVTVAELTRELQGHKGRPVILHFWATWCVPCLAELPFLARVARDARRKGVDFLPISLDSPTQKSAQHVSSLLAQRVQDARWSSILKVADVDAFMSGIDPGWEGAIPVFFALDSDLRLRRTHLGNITPAEFDALVAWVLPAKKK